MAKGTIVVSSDDTRRAQLRTAFGCQVSVARSAKELFARLRANRDVSLVVLDLSLKDVDGVKLLRLLKSTSETSTIQVAVLASPEQRTAAVQAGADFAVAADVDPATLKRRIDRANRTRPRMPKLPAVYENVTLVGVGGLANVYSAFDRTKKRDVVLKVFRKSPVPFGRSVQVLGARRFGELGKLKKVATGSLLGRSKTRDGKEILVLSRAGGPTLREMVETGRAHPKVVRNLGQTVKTLRSLGLEPLTSPGTVHVDSAGNLLFDVGVLSVPRSRGVNLERELPYLGRDGDRNVSRLLEDLSPPDAAPAESSGRDEPTSEGSFHWNTRIKRSTVAGPSEPWPRQLETGVEYDLETAIETLVAAGASVEIPAREIPPGTELIFEFRADGAELFADGARDAIVRSKPLLVTQTGTEAFRVKLVPRQQRVTLRADLCRGIALVASQVYTFEEDAAAPLSGASLAGRPSVEPCPPPVAPRAFDTEAPAVRLDVTFDQEAFWLRIESGALLGRRVRTHRSAKELIATAVRARKQLVELSTAYDSTNPGVALAAFREIGAEMYEAFFGDPGDPAVEPNLKEVGRIIANAASARMQIVSENLPFPWGVMNDGVAIESTRKGSAQDVRCFWGARFRIDRIVVGQVSRVPSPVLGSRPLRIQGCVNEQIDAEQKLGAAAAQCALLGDLARRQATTSPARIIRSRTEFEKWLSGDEGCELLYLFCHAGAAETISDLFFTVGTARNAQARLQIDDSGLIDLAAMRKLRKRPLIGEPFVFMNACSSAAGDEAFQSAFLEQFMASWNARGFLGTDWKVPTELADLFGRSVLALFVEEGTTIAEAIERVAKPMLDAGNPFPLIYALYSQPELRAGPGARK